MGKPGRARPTPEMVAGRHRAQQCARPRPRRVHAHDPKKIAASLRRSAEHSRRRKTSPFRSAMSMLTFYINRAGLGLEPQQKRVLEDAKDELRALYHKEKQD